MFRHHNKIADRPGFWPAVWNDGFFTFYYFNDEIGRSFKKLYEYKQRKD